MANFIERQPILTIALAIGGGLLIRSIYRRRAASQQSAYQQQLINDQNPWMMLTGNKMDAYQYYATSTQNTRLVYGVGQEVNLVSTEMLNNALQNQHDQILQEVNLEINSLRDSFDTYIQNSAYNPYETAIAGAAAGQQMSFPASQNNLNNINTN